MDPSEFAQQMLDSGRRGFPGVLAGGVWLTWGVMAAHSRAPLVLFALGLVAGFLLVCCGYCIVQGRGLLRNYPKQRRPLNLGFLLVVVLEGAGVGGVIAAAQKLGRLDLLPDWIGLVIGLHFFALAKVFGVPVYSVTGAAITLWCVLSWVFFRGNLMTIVVGVGVGTILWATVTLNLRRVLARRRHLV